MNFQSGSVYPRYGQWIPQLEDQPIERLAAAVGQDVSSLSSAIAEEAKKELRELVHIFRQKNGLLPEQWIHCEARYADLLARDDGFGAMRIATTIEKYRIIEQLRMVVGRLSVDLGYLQDLATELDVDWCNQQELLGSILATVPHVVLYDLTSMPLSASDRLSLPYSIMSTVWLEHLDTSRLHSYW
ncbi:MAG: hypothetical protein ACRERU_04555 [Methylococcales bacterium]